MSAVEEGTPLTPAPWAKYSWLLATPWLAFLAFPIVEIVQAPIPALAKVGTLTAVAAFVGTYLYGFITNTRTSERPMRSWIIVAIMTVLTVPVLLTLGTNVFGMSTYLTVYVIFSLPVRQAVRFVAVLVALTVLTIWLVGEPSQFIFAGITAGTSLFVGLIRWIDDRQQQRDVLEQQLALTIERGRVARDVHDVLGHSLTVITVKSELAERLIDADPEAAKTEIAAIRSLTREALAEVRATVAGLRVARLSDELAAAQEALTDAGIAVQLPQDVIAIDPRHRIIAAWVVREAVTNVVRHSGGRSCTVQLDQASLVVIDDGVGPGRALEPTALRGVRERVADSGGTLTVTAGESGGTRVEVRW